MTKRIYDFRASALAVALAAGACAAVVTPAAATAPASSDAAAPIAFNIPPGALGEALIRLSRATGLTVVADPEVVAGRTTQLERTGPSAGPSPQPSMASEVELVVELVVMTGELAMTRPVVVTEVSRPGKMMTVVSLSPSRS
jgi:hypothetical protein